jgi:hypothetical protein
MHILTVVLWGLYLLHSHAYRCINFYGIETEAAKPVCSWVHEPGWYLEDLVKRAHIDSIRLPFSYQYASCGNFTWLDKVIFEAAARNISVILDYHRGYADKQGPRPVEGDITEFDWGTIWLLILHRYVQYTNIKALTLFNEWQDMNKTEAQAMQLRLAREIENEFPGRYEYMFGCVDWGKDCSGMFEHLSDEVFSKRAFVEIHMYGFTNYTTERLESMLPKKPLRTFVGELGWMNSTNETTWAQTSVKWLKRKRVSDICFWTLAHSIDTGGFYKDDCITVEQDKIDLFNSLYDPPTCLRGRPS